MVVEGSIPQLLRFLSKDAKVPLPVAISKAPGLLEASLATPEAIAKVPVTKLLPIFGDEKSAKAVLAAAKRVSKKRSAAEPDDASPKRTRPSQSGMRPTNGSIEASLELPIASATEEELAATVLHSNRAPLVLAFAVMLLEHTQPRQPLSSRLSLAQAVVSANSRSKAVSLGLETGPSAEDQGWGQGQPVVKVMGRNIHILKRWGYSTEEAEPDADAYASQETLKGDGDGQAEYGGSGSDIPVWGLDLEAMRSKKPATAQTAELPIHRPEGARSYLVKAFTSPPHEAEGEKVKKKTASALAAEKEANCGLLLQAIDLLFRSWAPILGREELDRRAWSWYVTVRPDVASGVEGWGGRNEIKLRAILDLRRQPNADDGEPKSGGWKQVA